jgi:hypothetical protein
MNDACFMVKDGAGQKLANAPALPSGAGAQIAIRVHVKARRTVHYGRLRPNG